MTLLLSLAFLGPERPVATPAYGIPYGHQQGTAVASDGTDYVVIWADHDRQRLSSAHVSSSGEVLSEPSSLVDNDDAWGFNIFWTGESYTAIWFSNIRNEYGLRVGRLDRNGVLLEPVRTVMDKAPFQAAAWNGRNIVVVLEDGPLFELVLLSPEGDVVKRGIVARRDQTYTRAIVAAGDTFWLIHVNTTTIFATRFSANGELIDQQPLTVGKVTTYLDGVAAASNGRSVVVAAGQGTSSRSILHLYAIDAATRVVTETESAFGSQPFVTNDGQRYLVSWIGFDRTIETLPLDANGVPAALSSRSCCSGAVFGHSMSSNGQSYFAAWSDMRDALPQSSGMHVYGTLLDTSGFAAGNGVPLASSARNQLLASTDGSLVTWAELAPDGWRSEVRASRTGGAPVVLSQPGLIETTATLSTGSSYVVGWSQQANWDDPTRVYIRRLGLDGRPLDTAPTRLGGDWATGITFAPDLAVWSDGSGVVGKFLSSNGEPFVISKHGYRPRVAFNGTDYLVTWTEGSDYCPLSGFCPPNLRDVGAARVSSTGAVLDTIAIAGGGPDQHDQVVASDGRDFIVAYTLPTGIFARRVLANGAVIDAAPGVELASGTAAGATWHGRSYLIAYTVDDNLHAIEVEPQTAIAGNDTLIAVFATAAQPFGGSTIAYTRFAGEPVFGGAVRVFTRSLFDTVRRRTTR